MVYSSKRLGPFSLRVENTTVSHVLYTGSCFGEVSADQPFEVVLHGRQFISLAGLIVAYVITSRTSRMMIVVLSIAGGRYGNTDPDTVRSICVWIA